MYNHDSNLKKWALQARNVGLSQTLFSASATWVQNFKIKHFKEDKQVVTKTNLQNKETLIEQAKKFVENVKGNFNNWT